MDTQNPLELTTVYLGEDWHEFVAKLVYQALGEKGPPHWFGGGRLVGSGTSSVFVPVRVRFDCLIRE